MNNTIIEFNNVGKQYILGTIGTGTLSQDLNRWWASIRGKEDPYLKIGETNDRTQKGDSRFVWALRDINFKVEQGDVVGIVGKNGAGKSTLLKILSRVTSPTTGDIRIKGRIASLLEVGTGFHPEMTGRENIFMNGSIMGMTKAEIKSKFDEIVDFAGVAKYVDTPVKRYSSGMMVRLGFAIAAHLEPEILVVDEVLAVGDAEFQKKAIGKMQDVSKGEGRTVLFVSHNMAAVRSLCTRGVMLKNGMVDFIGNIQETLSHYLRDEADKQEKLIINNIKWKKSTLTITNIEINNSKNTVTTIKSAQKTLEIKIEGITEESMVYDVMLILKSKEGVPLASYARGHYDGLIKHQDSGCFTFHNTITLPQILSRGIIIVDLYIHHPTVEYYLKAPDCCILESEGYQSSYGVSMLQETNGLCGLTDY
ncbi:lipopolysaccharide transport system ATP-binding protein [Xylanibacter ruminicola]|uniref:ABC transporter ATP-binding protein n=1 Tax=Xylanibacter ruminicola TaxID=839 RepID=UPI0008F45296|nr:ABC transporter ATP-binding protein [Xylanibacter ruminicola]SFC13193.1 lipopolysaccharide transport system ATP-binding protein [Xylanibacter ruminicola]